MKFSAGASEAACGDRAGECSWKSTRCIIAFVAVQCSLFGVRATMQQCNNAKAALALSEHPVWGDRDCFLAGVTDRPATARAIPPRVAWWQSGLHGHPDSSQ